MSDALIRKAFETRVRSWGLARTPPLPVAFENAPFSKPANGRYARAIVLPGNTTSRDLEGKHREYVGVFQVTLVIRQNVGTADATSLAKSLDEAFPTGPPLQQDGLNVWITRPMGAAPAIQEPDSYEVPVSATYKAELFLA